jgi:hypothetical protein
VWRNLHLWGCSFKLHFPKTSHNFASCSLRDLAYITISSKKTKQHDPESPLNTVFIIPWNVDGAVLSPYGSLLYSQWPFFVLKAFFPYLFPRPQFSESSLHTGSIIWSQVPEWAQHQDMRTDWSSVFVYWTEYQSVWKHGLIICVVCSKRYRAFGSKNTFIHIEQNYSNLLQSW